MKQNSNIFNREAKPVWIEAAPVIAAKSKTARGFKSYATKQNPGKKNPGPPGEELETKFFEMPCVG